MKNTKLAFCKFSKYPILKSIRVKFSRYKQKSMNVSVSFDTLIIIPNTGIEVKLKTECMFDFCSCKRVSEYDRMRQES